MPLSQAVSRENIHTRDIQCRAYLREDGLYDVEGHLTDIKSYSFPSEFRGTVAAGEPIHNLWIRLTVDNDFKIHEVEAQTDQGPFPSCPAIAPNFKKLEGLSIGRGWRKMIREHLGGVQGCTHLVELLGPVATTAFQAVHGDRARQERSSGTNPRHSERAEERDKRPRLLNSCYAMADTGEIVKKFWPEWHREEDSTKVS